MTEILKAR